MAITFNTYLNQLRWEDRQREQRERDDRVDSNQAFSKFSSIAGNKIRTAAGIASVSSNETDINTINESIKEIEDQKTGVSFVDGVIDVSRSSLELRKRAVITRNEIDNELNTLTLNMGQGKTEGAKKILDDLESQYVMMADNMVTSNKNYLRDKLDSAKEQFEYNLYKDEFDTDKEKEGYQLPDTFTELDKEYFNAELKSKMNISEKTGSYTDIIADLKKSFPEMRADRQSLKAAQAKVDAAKLKADATIASGLKEDKDEFQLASDKRYLEGFKARLSGSKNTLGILGAESRDSAKMRDIKIAAGMLPTDITMAGTDPSGFNPDAMINSIENSILTLFTTKDAQQARDRTEGQFNERNGLEMLDLDVGDVNRQQEFEEIYRQGLENDYGSGNRFVGPVAPSERKAIIDLYQLRKDLLNFKKMGFPSAEAADPSTKEGSMAGWQ